ncbi:hypothetical protein ACWC4E_08505 [Streptomyces sp. NPDC001273]|uniref:hypothetical protein n=2 Tax=unclassified Streptomyces TaxID=2593676 RepID=UPI0033E9E2FC
MAMPRPTVASLAYGSCTVICSALAMLLLSGTSSVLGVAAVAVSALALGLLVAMTVPRPAPRRLTVVARPAAPEPVRATVPSPVREPAREPVRERAAS